MTETPAVPYSPKEQSPPQLRQAGTVVELSKHRPFAQHVGATHHRYPIDVVGDTLLRQQALLTINNLLPFELELGPVVRRGREGVFLLC